MRQGLEIDSAGTKRWFKDGLLHREDGPAVEWFNVDKWWYIDGKLHREDGPAIEYYSGYILWYINGKTVRCKTNEEFLRLMKLKAFL